MLQSQKSANCPLEGTTGVFTAEEKSEVFSTATYYYSFNTPLTPLKGRIKKNNPLKAEKLWDRTRPRGSRYGCFF
ncbi:MAG: hypothetical protein LPK19_14350, partial [Hymenobacteraceae bacterium]|nr:hypothetical protein [Hymenobacteraceae bacterium]MDX5397412.1 hypothetical protein [Hymenobacteraceae bacterium]MDX5513490.1 hypothetical protein [Hymenobacteraceae bacterium]